MAEWLLSLLSFIASLVPSYVAPPKKDYVGVVAAEVAYVAVLPNTPVKKPLIDTKDCKRCNGTGRIRTGDDINWTDCPDCEPKDGGTNKVSATLPAASMELQVKPLPPVPPASRK